MLSSISSPVALKAKQINDPEGPCYLVGHSGHLNKTCYSQGYPLPHCSQCKRDHRPGNCYLKKSSSSNKATALNYSTFSPYSSIPPFEQSNNRAAFLFSKSCLAHRKRWCLDYGCTDPISNGSNLGNHCPTSASINGEIPELAWHCKISAVELHPFSSRCFAQIPSANVKSLDLRAVECLYLGPAINAKGHT